MSFWKDKKTLVTGGHGFVGHAVLEELDKLGCTQVIAPKKQECDLTIESNVKELFSSTNPEIVIHLAGKVGGIGANKSAKGEFFYKNIMMGTLLFEHSRLNGVEKLVALAAGCGYPKHLQNALKENDFWDGLPDENSIGYSMAKKMLIIQSWTYREQYGFNSSVLLPANLYGPHDNYDLETCHVIPALVRKFVEAVENNEKEVSICCIENVDIELDALDRIEFGNAQYYTITYGDRNLVLWQDGETIYSIIGETTQDDLLAMAAETRGI